VAKHPTHLLHISFPIPSKKNIKKILEILFHSEIGRAKEQERLRMKTLLGSQKNLHGWDNKGIEHSSTIGLHPI
jgi:hypothetical protein